MDETANEHSQAEAPAPFLSVTGLRKDHALRAKKWLRDRSILAFYSAADKSLNAPETNHGKAWTYEAMHEAIDATRNW